MHAGTLPVNAQNALAKLGKSNIVAGEFESIKLSLFRYDYPMIGKFSIFKNVKIASIEDIAAMKLSAISGRATKRDYVDLYFISRIYEVDKIIDFYIKKFGDTGNNIYVIMKALGFFEDAEGDEMPKMIKKVVWNEVKVFFSKETIRLAKKYI